MEHEDQQQIEAVRRERAMQRQEERRRENEAAWRKAVLDRVNREYFSFEAVCKAAVFSAGRRAQ